ncbi:MAG: hypothetical protein HC836_25860 [Richelia sp. RM2_1_2]|nr:hypothetical protein [Richelia sp. RM2_1_2]
MLKNKHLLCDVDECILQWTNGFTKFLHQHHNIIPSRIRDDHSVYKWLEIHPEEAHNLVTEFNSSHQFAALEPFDGAQKILPKLYNEGYTIVAITCCSSDSIIAAMRRENLHKYFGNIFQDIICLDFYDDKKAVLSRYKNAFWIEDNMEWAVAGADLGHKTFLINHKHNESLNDSRIIRVDDWHIIYSMIYEYNFPLLTANV